MATMQGITGKLSGKMGAAVFRVRSGQQVVTQYNPSVKNPNSEGQQAQRAKFKLMSQLAAVMSTGFGTMGVTKRAGKGTPSQRNAFVSLNMPLVEVSEDTSTGVVATIPMEKLQLTSSARYLGEMTTMNTTQARRCNVNNIPTEVESVRFVVVGNLNAAEKPVIKLIQDVSVEDNTAVLNLLDFAYGVDEDKITVLAYGLIPLTEVGKTSLDNIHANGQFASAITLSNLTADGDLVMTETLGANFEAI